MSITPSSEVLILLQNRLSLNIGIVHTDILAQCIEHELRLLETLRLFSFLCQSQRSRLLIGVKLEFWLDDDQGLILLLSEVNTAVGLDLLPVIDS